MQIWQIWHFTIRWWYLVSWHQRYASSVSWHQGNILSDTFDSWRPAPHRGGQITSFDPSFWGKNIVKTLHVKQKAKSKTYFQIPFDSWRPFWHQKLDIRSKVAGKSRQFGHQVDEYQSYEVLLWTHSYWPLSTDTKHTFSYLWQLAASLTSKRSRHATSDLRSKAAGKSRQFGPQVDEYQYYEVLLWTDPYWSLDKSETNHLWLVENVWISDISSFAGAFAFLNVSWQIFIEWHCYYFSAVAFDL